MNRQAPAVSLPSPVQDDVADILLALADRVLEQARSRGAAAAECFIQTASGRSLSIERNQLAATEQSGEAGIGLRVVKDRRFAFAYFTRPEEAGEIAARALDAAAKAPKSRAELPGPSNAPRIERLWDDAVMERDGQALAADARALIDGAREVDPEITVAGGSAGVACEASVVANTEGVQAVHRATETGAGVYVVARHGDDVATGQHSHESTTMDDISRDPAGISRVAAERANDLLAAKPLEESGKLPVVFTPQALSALLEFMVLPALIGERAARGESVYAEREQEVVADKRIRLLDDPTRPGGLGSAPTCDEGLASRPVPLLEHGKVGRYLHDVGSAYKWADGADSLTASALRTGGLSDGRSYQDPPTATPRQIVLEADDTKPLDDLLSGLDHALFVVDVLGAHTGNRTSGDFSVTSTQLWEVRQGARTPVAGAMLAGNLPDLLKDHYLGMSREREQVAGHFSPTGLDLPYIVLGDVTTVGS